MHPARGWFLVMADCGPTTDGEWISLTEGQLKQMVAEAAATAILDCKQCSCAPTGDGQAATASATGTETRPRIQFAYGLGFWLWVTLCMCHVTRCVKSI